MPGPFQVQPAAGPDGNPYLPPGPTDPLIFEQFDGINTQTTRPGVDDKQAAWLDGFMPITERKLRTLYDIGPALFTPNDPDTISFFNFFNIQCTII